MHGINFNVAFKRAIWGTDLDILIEIWVATKKSNLKVQKSRKWLYKGLKRPCHFRSRRDPTLIIKRWKMIEWRFELLLWQ